MSEAPNTRGSKGDHLPSKETIDSGPAASLFGAQSTFTESDEVRMYRELLDAIPVAVYFKDLQARFVGVNAYHADAVGRNRDELIGLSDDDIYAESEAELYRSVDRRVMDDGTEVSGLTEIQSYLNAPAAQFKTPRFPVRNREGDVIGLMGFSQDITGMSTALEELQKSEVRYALATRATRDGIWEYDLETSMVSLSPRCSHLLSMPITSEPVPLDVVSEKFAREDLAMLRQGLFTLFDAPEETFECEVQVNRDGERRWLQVVYTAYSEGGRVSRVIGSAADVTEERARLSQLEFHALHDHLTGLANRRALVRELGAALEALTHPREARRQLSLLCVDLDSFKIINDSLGHQAGDAMLNVVAQRLRKSSNLIEAQCTVGRLGGDEFAIIVEHSDSDAVEAFAERLVKELSQPTLLFGLEVYSSASVGLVHVTDQRDATDVLRDGDIALYRAKSRGKSRVALFDTSMREQAQAALDAQTKIRRAVDKRNFALVYQPIVHAKSRRVAGFEALIRLDGEDGNSILPSRFLDYLEQSDLIIDVGRWVLDRALADLSVWRKSFPELDDLSLAVNVSRRQFADPHLFSVTRELLERHELPPHTLTLEITETAAVSHGVDLFPLANFRAAGGRVAIDDFGTGHSSLFALHEIPVDILKLDRSFTTRVGRQADRVLEATFEFVRALDLDLVAEGVESEQQAEWLERRGATFLQGYAFSKPMRPIDVWDYLNAEYIAFAEAPSQVA